MKWNNNFLQKLFTMLNPIAVMIHIVMKTLESKTRATIDKNEKLIIFFWSWVAIFYFKLDVDVGCSMERFFFFFGLFGNVFIDLRGRKAWHERRAKGERWNEEENCSLTFFWESFLVCKKKERKEERKSPYKLEPN